jgi:putative nucleotidyltransferase with HDIG domain
MNQLSFIQKCDICVNSRILEILEDMLRIKGDLVYLHSVQVSRIARLIAESLDYPDPEKIRIAGLFHDLGKIYIPDTVLSKNGELTEREKETVKMHPIMGAEILNKYGFQDIADIILYHHERPDGSGYPYGISRVPYESTIIAVADIFVALTNYRPYKPAYPVKEALKITVRSVEGFFSPSQIKRIQKILVNGGSH